MTISVAKPRRDNSISVKPREHWFSRVSTSAAYDHGGPTDQGESMIVDDKTPIVTQRDARARREEAPPFWLVDEESYGKRAELAAFTECGMAVTPAHE